jgi:hypothetical protein
MTLPNGCKIWLALGADRLAQITDWTWTDVTAYVLYDNGAGVTFEIGYPEGSGEANPTSIRFLASNADGRWSPHNPTGAWFGQIGEGTPVKVTFDNGLGAKDLALAYLADLPVRWTTGRKFAYVPIEAFGLLADLESSEASESNAYRWLFNFRTPVAYWPCEDGRDATRIASAIEGVPDSTVFNDVTFAGDSEFGGSKPLPTFDSANSYMVFAVPAYPRPSPEAWSMCSAWRVPERPAGTVYVNLVSVSSGSIRLFRLEMTSATPSVLYLRGYDASGVELLGHAGLSFDDVATSELGEPFGEQLAIVIRAQQNGADIDWGLNIWRENLGATGSIGTLAASTLGPVYALTAGQAGDLSGHTVAHFALFNNVDAADFAAPNIASGGRGDLAADRFAQQAILGGVPFDYAAGGVGEPMGAVPVDTPLNVLRETDAIEDGLFFESPAGALTLLRVADLTNQPVALTLAHGTHLESMEPTDASRDFVNRAVVSRNGGSSVTVDARGPLSPTTRGKTKSRPISVNALSDTNLRTYGEWATAVGTTQDYRYVINLLFHASAAPKLDDWQATSIGDRVQITGPPVDLPPDTVDTYLRGYSGRVTRFEYAISARLAPYAPYRTFEFDGAGNLGRLASSGSRLIAAITSSATSATVGTYGNPSGRTGVAAKWSATSLPYSLGLRKAEQVTCTAVANVTPTYVGVGTAASADYAAVTPGAVAGIAAGDCELLFAAVRDSGDTALSGVAERIKTYVGDQIGWNPIAEFGNANGSVWLWARTYQSALLTPPPTITPIIGAAGDTVSAQLAALRGVQPLAHSTGIALSNASAANIAYPGISISRNATVALLLVHKHDDLTSTTAPAGFTKIADVSSTAGGDHAMAWYYQIQTTATDIAAGSVTVTGGASATSRATMVSMLGDVQTLTLTRNVNGISGGVAHPVGADVQLWRAGKLRRP